MSRPARRRFLVAFTLQACEEIEAPSPEAALSKAEDMEAPPLSDFVGLGSEIVAEWDKKADKWVTVPAPLPLEQIPTHDLIMELHKRQRLVPNPHGVEPCLTLVVTPGDIAEYWESDESGATHPGSRVPEPSEWPALVKAFERWQDCGSFTDLMQTLRDAWQAEQARQLDKEGGSK